MSAKKEYQTTVYCGTENGKELYKHIRAGTQRELNAKANALKAQVRDGKNIYNKAFFGVWAEKWLNEIKIPSGIGNGTLIQYKSAIAHLNREFEYTELKLITLSAFQSYINELAEENPNTGKPMAKATLESIKKVASGIFGYARSNNIAGVPDFFKSVMIPKNSPVNMRRALTETEQQWIIDTPHRAQLPAMIMMFAGLRKGEVIPLEWSDVDLKKGIISVNKSIEFIENKGNIKQGGKTVNAKRKIPMPPILIEYLASVKKCSKVLSKYICLNEAGNIHTKSSWRKMWDSYLNDLNVKYGYDGDISKFNPKYGTELPMRVPRITPHYLRHTFATMLYLENINVVTAKQFLGHADIETTVNIYTDLQNFNKAELSESYKTRLETDYKIPV